jgi:sphingomyelin phosphodiesterase
MWQLYDPQDPGGQLEWLQLQLEMTSRQNKTCHVIGHVPPGHEDCFKTWSREFYKIVGKYRNTIRGQFYGHTHYDEFRVLHSPTVKSDPINVMWIGPSLTPYRIENPGYRVYHVDLGIDHTFGDVVDHETWIYDLDKANAEHEANSSSFGLKDVEWFQLYRATEAYDLPNLLPHNLKSFVIRMAKDRKTFDLFYRSVIFN